MADQEDFETVEDYAFVQHVVDKKPMEFGQEVKAALYSRLSDAIEVKRDDIAQNMFSNESEQ